MTDAAAGSAAQDAHHPLVATEPVTRASGIAARLGCTEGQLYSMAIALTSACALVLLGGVPLLPAPLPGITTALPESAPAATVEVGPSAASPDAPLTSPADLTPVVTPLLPGRPGAPGAVDPAPATTGRPAVRPTALPTVLPTAGRSRFPVPAPGLPRALVSDATRLFVGTDNGAGGASRLVVLSRTDGSARSIAITGQPDARSGGLAAAGMRGAELLVTDRSRAALLQIDPRTGTQRVLARLPDLPPCLVGVTGTCQPGAQDRPPSPEGLAVAGNYAYIADAAQGTVWRYAFATKQLTAWYSSADFATGSGPSGLALDPAGNLVFTVAESVDPQALLNGALYRLTITPAGGPGTSTLLATFTRGATPGPLAVGRSGDVYVGLRTTGGIVVIHPDGTATALVGATPSRIPAPGGLSLTRGTLYVADAGRPATAGSGSVQAVALADAPVR
ncbi:MAG: hypothetical protein JWL64_1581 [Frankiales bacterium]|nr:hypothetical protein [Frankiales bacterium]